MLDQVAVQAVPAVYIFVMGALSGGGAAVVALVVIAEMAERAEVVHHTLEEEVLELQIVVLLAVEIPEITPMARDIGLAELAAAEQAF